MTDERIFERLAAHAGPADVDPGFEDRLYALLQREMRRSGRPSRTALLLVAALLLILTMTAAAAVGSGVIEVPGEESPAPSAMDSSPPTPTLPEPSARGGWPPAVRGWPSTSVNGPGEYSWDGSGSCAGAYCISGFMHNGYGSGDVTITVGAGGGGSAPRGATAVTVAGHDGFYRRIDAQQEEWMVKIEGTTMIIRLSAEPGTSEADLAEAHAIIDSMRTEARDNDLGFRLLFTLTTADWDSG